MGVHVTVPQRTVLYLIGCVLLFFSRNHFLTQPLEKLDNYPTTYPRGFYVWSEDIASGVWSDPVYFDNPGFDADLFWDDDGTVYLSNTRAIVFNGPHAVSSYISKIDLATGNTLTRPEVLVNSTVPWIEGTHIYKLNGTYYLFTAAGGTQTNSHQEQAFRSSVGPTGPWEPCPWNPIAHNPSGVAVQNTGHADIVQAPDGNWWAVLLARRNQGKFAQLGKTTKGGFFHGLILFREGNLLSSCHLGGWVARFQ